MLSQSNASDLASEIDELLQARPSRRPFLPSPLLERAQALISSRLPASEEEVCRRLMAAALTHTPVDLARIERACRFGRNQPRFTVLRREGLTLAVDPPRLALASTAYALAVRAVVNFGFALIARVTFQSHAEDEDFVRTVVSAQRNFEWLDRRLGWFWFRNDKSKLLRTIEKILVVASKVPLRDLHKALFRRFAPDNAPSARALRTLCERVPGVEIDGMNVRMAKTETAPKILSDRESALVEMFRRWGPRIDGHRLPTLCEDLGLGAVAVGRHLRASPFVLEPHPGVFRLIGT